jgi:hypothetical protein
MDPHSREADTKVRVLMEQLLRINTDTYQAGLYEVAYHVLAAALHCADELADPELVTAVQELAERQQAELDQGVPAHPLSTTGATGRGTNPLFTSLGRTAHAAAIRIKGQQVQEHAGAVRRRQLPGMD